MASVTIPTEDGSYTGPGYTNVRAGYRTAGAISESPYNFTQQVYSWAGKAKVCEFSLPPMKEADADDWTQFFDSMNGFENTTTLDLSDYYPHDAGVSSVEMRLMNADSSWDINTIKHYGISFSLMEVI